MNSTLALSDQSSFHLYTASGAAALRAQATAQVEQTYAQFLQGIEWPPPVVAGVAHAGSHRICGKQCPHGRQNFVDAVYQRCLDRASAWQTWSSTVGLLESSDEAQALAMHAKLVADRPQWAQEKAMQVLGAAFALGCSFPESWRQGNLQLSLPAGAETFSQAHQIRQVWRHILQEK